MALENLRFSEGYIWLGIVAGLFCYFLGLFVKNYWFVILGIVCIGIQLTKGNPEKKIELPTGEKAKGQWER